MNYKNYAIATVAATVFIFAFEFLVHGVMMAGTYAATSELWRPMEAMNSMMGLSIAIQIATALIVVCGVKTYRAYGMRDGAQMGLFLGILLGVMQFGAYVYLPIPMSLAAMWFVALVVKMTGVGAIAGALYRD